MSTPTAIILRGADALSSSALPDAIAQRDRLLKLAVKGTTIESPEQAARAADFIRDLNAFASYVETGRTLAKQPVLDQGRAIDELARTLTGDVVAQKKRIEAMLGTYQQAQDRKAQNERAEAAERERKVREEAAAAQRRADQEARAAQDRIDADAAEQRRLLAERLAATTAPKETAKLKEKLAEVDTKAAELTAAVNAENTVRAEQISEAATAAVVETRVAVPMPARPAGVAVRKVIEWEVTNIRELYEAVPLCVTLVENKSAIRSALKQLVGKETLPGVRHWESAAAAVRG